MRILVFILIGLILFSLGSALFYLIRDQGKSTNTVKMLAIRVGLSIALFLILIIGHKLGFITGRLT
jgi:Na+-driven multidrug efflux pump